MGTGWGLSDGAGEAIGEGARDGLVFVGSRKEKKLCDSECLCCHRN